MQFLLWFLPHDSLSRGFGLLLKKKGGGGIVVSSDSSIIPSGFPTTTWELWLAYLFICANRVLAHHCTSNKNLITEILMELYSSLKIYPQQVWISFWGANMSLVVWSKPVKLGVKTDSDFWCLDYFVWFLSFSSFPGTPQKPRVPRIPPPCPK